MSYHQINSVPTPQLFYGQKAGTPVYKETANSSVALGLMSIAGPSFSSGSDSANSSFGLSYFVLPGIVSATVTESATSSFGLSLYAVAGPVAPPWPITDQATSLLALSMYSISAPVNGSGSEAGNASITLSAFNPA